MNITLLKLVAIIFVLDWTQVLFADCGPQDQIRGVSANGIYQLDIERVPESRFSIRRNGIIVVSSGIKTIGHHATAFIDDTGAFFVLHDKYEGLAVYDASGQRLGELAPRDLLTVREQWTRPDKWACHPEGRWAPESEQMQFFPQGAAIKLFTHTGRAIVVDLRSVRVERSDSDFVQLAIALGLPITLLPIIWIWWRAKARQVSARV